MRLRADAKCWLIRILLDLHIAQPLPAPILLGLVRSWILKALEPEAEPVDGAALGGHTDGRIRQHVLVGVEHDEVHGLLQIVENGVGPHHRAPPNTLTEYAGTRP